MANFKLEILEQHWIGETDLVIRMPLREYASEIVVFAREARRFYWLDGPRRIAPDEVEFHERFWAEFDERLNRAEAAIRAR